MAKIKQLAAVMVFACALGTNAQAEGVEGMSGTGSWL